MAYLVQPPPGPPPPRFMPIFWPSPIGGPTSLDSPVHISSPRSPFPFLNGAVTHTPPPSPALPSSPVKAGVKRTRRKRCGTCSGCTITENCGRCVVCTNPNATNQLCKQRRCELLLQRPSTLTSSGVSSQPPFNEIIAQDDNSLFDTLNPHINGLTNNMTPDELSYPLRKRKRASGISKPTIKEPPSCGCPGYDDGHYYTHLGSGSSPDDLRVKLEKRFDVTGKELRMLELSYSGIEAKTAEGCPTAEWVIRRTSKEEKFLVLYRYHLGHTCNDSYTVVSIVYWDALEEKKSSHIYQKLTELLPPYGLPTQRKCEFNINKTCACQGYRDVGGASYSFGCSWSVYYNGCKFARSKIPRKFRLQVPEKEEELESTIQAIATDVGPLYKWLAPQAFSNQVSTQSSGKECRLGNEEEKPFSGMTCCMDFCAHSHYDKHNMADGGATIVVTILKEQVYKEEYAKNPSEQLHCLPLYHLKDPPSKSEPGIEVRPVQCESSPPTTFGSLHPPHPPAAVPNSQSFPHNIPSTPVPLHTSTPDSSTNPIVKQEPLDSSTPTKSKDISSSISPQNEMLNESHSQTRPRFLNGFVRPPDSNIPPIKHYPPNGLNGFHLNGLLTRPGMMNMNDSSTDSDSDCYVVSDSPPPPPSSHCMTNSFTGQLPMKAETPLTPTPTPTSIDTLPRVNGYHASHIPHPLNGMMRPAGFHTPPPSYSQTHVPTLGLTEPMSHPFDHILTPGTPLGLPMDRLTPPTLPSSPLTSDIETPEKRKTPPLPIVVKNERLYAVPGGVALALTSSSVLVECAKKELHATTAIRNPNKNQPTRISMVFYQHKHLRRRYHGYYEEEQKQKERQEEQLRRKLLEAEQENQFGLFPQFRYNYMTKKLQQSRIINYFPSVRIPPTYRPCNDICLKEDDHMSDCSDTVDSMLQELNDFDSCEEVDEDSEMEEDMLYPVKTRVSKETLLSETEQPFYLELPLKKIDQELSILLPPRLYPCPLLSLQTHSTTTLSFSSSKPPDVISGNHSESKSKYFL